MKDTGSSKQITTMTFIGMTCALVASVRNIPDVAATSWTMIFYMLVAVLLYAFPISLISGEFAGMFPQKGGPELWVSNALGKKMGVRCLMAVMGPNVSWDGDGRFSTRSVVW